MATVKTPEERGPLGAWAYDSRDRLDISPEQVVELLGKYDTSTIRKAEGNSEAMSRPLWRALTQLYARLASERSVTLDAMPTFGEVDQATGDQSDLITALNRQSLAIESLVTLLIPLLGDKATDVVGRLDELEAVVDGLVGLGTEGATDPTAPRETEG